jgi:hypothetical protein
MSVPQYHVQELIEGTDQKLRWLFSKSASEPCDSPDKAEDRAYSSQCFSERKNACRLIKMDDFSSEVVWFLPGLNHRDIDHIKMASRLDSMCISRQLNKHVWRTNGSCTRALCHANVKQHVGLESPCPFPDPNL